MCSRPSMPPRSMKAPKSRDVLDHPFAHLSLFELLDDFPAQALALLLEDGAPRDDDVAARLVELDDLEVELLAEELIEVLHLPDVDLRAGQEGFDPEQVDDDAALDPSRQLSLHRRAGVVGVLDFVPHAHEVGLLFREHDAALEVFDVLEEDLDFVAYGDRLRIGELPDRNGAFRLETDVDQHLLRMDADDAAFDDFSFVLSGKALLVHRRELLHLLLGSTPAYRDLRSVCFRTAVFPGCRELPPGQPRVFRRT